MNLDFGFKTKSIEGNGTFTGHGSIFNNVDAVKDVVMPSAFKSSLESWRKKGSLPALLWQHDNRQPIGVYTRMEEDEKGLYVEGKLLKDDIQQAKEAYALLTAGAIKGLSIGYNVKIDEFNRETGVTSLKEIDLWEVSLVTFPCNDQANVETVKSLETEREIERFLREKGLSRTEACGILAKVRKIYSQGEPDMSELAQIIKNRINIWR